MMEVQRGHQDPLAQLEKVTQRLGCQPRREAFDHVARQFRTQLRAMIEHRMESSLRKRVDPSDVVQEGLIAAFDRLDDFLRRRPMRFDLWLRKMTLERLIDARRKHYAQRRDVRMETIVPGSSVQGIPGSLSNLSGSGFALGRSAKAELLRRALSLLGEIDRKILLLRYVDELTNLETARVLQITPAAASKRHGRALLRLSSRLQELKSDSD